VPIGAGRYLAERMPNARFVELSGDDHLPFVGDTAELHRHTREFLASLGPVASVAPPPPVRLVALFRDGDGRRSGLAAELAKPLDGARLASAGDVTGYAFPRGVSAAIFLQRLAESGDGPLEGALEATAIPKGDEAAAVERLAALVEKGGARTAIGPVAAAILLGSSVPIGRDPTTGELTLTLGRGL